MDRTLARAPARRSQSSAELSWVSWLAEASGERWIKWIKTVWVRLWSTHLPDEPSNGKTLTPALAMRSCRSRHSRIRKGGTVANIKLRRPSAAGRNKFMAPPAANRTARGRSSPNPGTNNLGITTAATAGLRVGSGKKPVVPGRLRRGCAVITDSKSVGLRPVGVQVPPGAPIISKG